jgi:hypothetical protein
MRVYQCKHVKSITAAGLKRLVDVFLTGKFLPETKEFFLCTNRLLRAGKLDDAWQQQAKRLQARGITAFRWDEEELLSLLRREPQLVFYFFGPAWFEEFYGRPPDEFSRRLPPSKSANLPVASVCFTPIASTGSILVYRSVTARRAYDCPFLIGSSVPTFWCDVSGIRFVHA